MKKLTSLEDTATITITGRDAVMLYTLVGQSTGEGAIPLYEKLGNLLVNKSKLQSRIAWECTIHYGTVQHQQESIAFPETKKDLMLKELQSKMDALQCEIDKIKGETF